MVLFLGKFGFQGAQRCRSTHLPARPCFQQQQNSKGVLCFESTLVIVRSYFSVLFCRTLALDFDDRHMLVGRFFCSGFGNYNALLWAVTSAFSSLGYISILARIVHFTIKEIAISFDEQA